MRQLSIPPETVPFELVTAAYEDLTLEFLPKLLDGVEAAVQQLASKYQIALICNTGYTGGRVLRQVLARARPDRLLRRADLLERARLAEAGPEDLPPHPGRAGVPPEHALHIGDTEDMDIAGAKAAGMYSARYLPEGDNDGAITQPGGHAVLRLVRAGRAAGGPPAPSRTERSIGANLV